MNLDELADLSADKLESLSNEQLTEILKPYFTVTRPELAPKQNSSGYRQEQIPLTPQKRAALALMAEEGLDLGFLRMKKKG